MEVIYGNVIAFLSNVRYEWKLIVYEWNLLGYSLDHFFEEGGVLIGLFMVSVAVHAFFKVETEKMEADKKSKKDNGAKKDNGT